VNRHPKPAPGNLKPPWPKGTSGNPGGRPRGVGEYVRLKTRDLQAQVDFFLDIFAGKPIPEPTKDNPRATRYPTFAERRDAAIVLLERGDGKPRQTAEVAMRELQPVVIRVPESPNVPTDPTLPLTDLVDDPASAAPDTEQPATLPRLTSHPKGK
jgi:hypothetical protein